MEVCGNTVKLIIGASRNEKIGSKLLQWWMGTDYSHVFAMWDLTAQERSIVYQASHGMVHFQSYPNFLFVNEITHKAVIDISDVKFKRFSQKCIDLAGMPYSKLELLQIFICNITGGLIGTRDQTGYICSELMADLLEDIGYTFDKPKYLLTPKDIIRKLE